jgi:hypothetical protein
MRRIPLSQGKLALVDDHWYPELSKHKWYYHEGYAVRKERVPNEKNKWVTIRMHRVVAKCDDPSLLVDHEDGNKLNNQEENLRVCTQEENNRNVKKTWGGTSKYKGVTYQEGAEKPWIAQIGYNGKRIYLGNFYTEEEAANIYNLAAKELFGDYASINEEVDK